MDNPKIIAFHLPQFHRIPENDAWWGEGFTEWTNVRKARPLYRNHYQPRVPLGERYYDMLDSETHEWQANLARSHGIYGFCYYHYWFNGKRLLERPIELMLERRKPDFPFCLAWANEPWTRAWDGGDRQVLMRQNYGNPEQWQSHIDYLLGFFKDPRYIRVHGKPMLLIYRTSAIRELQPMLELWNREVRKAGFPAIHLVGMATQFEADPRVHLLDAFADFEPMLTLFRYLRRSVRRKERWMSSLAKFSWLVFGRAHRTPNSYDYATVWKAILRHHVPPNHYPGVFVDWDNSPRRGVQHSLVLRNFDRKAFAEGFAAQLARAVSSEAPFMFINAWNEWAEGTYLEPDQKRGMFFLETIRDALRSQVNPRDT